MDDLTLDFDDMVNNDSRNEYLERENANLRKTLQIYNIEELIEMTDIEYICIKEISRLRRLTDHSGLTSDDIKSLDTLHKNLKLVRNKEEKKKPSNNHISEEDLINIAKQNG